MMFEPTQTLSKRPSRRSNRSLKHLDVQTTLTLYQLYQDDWSDDAATSSSAARLRQYQHEQRQKHHHQIGEFSTDEGHLAIDEMTADAHYGVAPRKVSPNEKATERYGTGPLPLPSTLEVSPSLVLSLENASISTNDEPPLP